MTCSDRMPQCKGISRELLSDASSVAGGVSLGNYHSQDQAAGSGGEGGGQTFTEAADLPPSFTNLPVRFQWGSYQSIRQAGKKADDAARYPPPES